MDIDEIIIIVIIIILFIMSILLCFCIKKFINNDNDYNIIGGNNLKIPTKFPQVGVLTNNILREHDLNDFVVLDKTDGLHINMAFLGNCIYSIVKGKLKKIQKVSYNFPLTILDTEYYKQNGMYYVFDACYINNVDISNLFFEERMNRAKEFIQSHNKLKNIIIKNYYKIVSLEKIINQVNTNETNAEGIRVDGVIFQLKYEPYFKSAPTCFKLKRKVMNTIDFRLKLDGNCFKLYLSGKEDDLKYNLRQLPIDDNKGIKNNETYFDILFASPYMERCDIFIPRNDWDQTGYGIDNINEITKLMNDIIDNKTEFDNKIIEMSLANDGWVPMRIREDKQFPNGYNVGISNCSVMFSPVSIADIYFEKETAFGEDVTKPYHKINRIIRKYIIEKTINPINKKLSVLDLAGGRGGDEEILYHAGARNIFAVDNDTEALVQYVMRTPNMIKNKDKYTFLLPNTKEPTIEDDAVRLNIIHGCLGKNNDSIIDEITGRYEYPDNKFDVILMNYAIHYLCYSDNCITALNNTINELLSDTGVFIFSRFDGEKIHNDMTNGKLKLTTFELSLIEDKCNDTVKWCNMALPTIDKTGYREEPLVLDRFIKLFDLKIVDEYYPAIDLQNNITKIENYNTVYDYLKYIKITVMRKK